MIYITGDTHRDFYRIYDIEKNKDNMLIILGDAGINYYLDLTKAAMCFFEQAPNLDNIKFIDKYGYFKVDRIELEIAKWWKIIEFINNFYIKNSSKNYC